MADPADLVLEKLRELGVSAHVEGSKLVLVPGSRVPPEMMPEMKARKDVIIRKLHATLYDLPFPMGYGGLPRAQVEMAEAIQEKLGIKDPVLRKYNVLSWIRTHLQYLSLNHGPLYEAVMAEQRRLRAILDEATKRSKP